MTDDFARVLAASELISRLRQNNHNSGGEENLNRILTDFVKEFAASIGRMFGAVIKATATPIHSEGAGPKPIFSSMTQARYDSVGGSGGLYIAIDKRAIDALAELACGAATDGKRIYKDRAVTLLDRKIFEAIAGLIPTAFVNCSEERGVVLAGFHKYAGMPEDIFVGALESNVKAMWLDVRCEALSARFFFSFTTALLMEEEEGKAAPLQLQSPVSRKEALVELIDDSEICLKAVIDETGIAFEDIENCVVGTTLALRASPQSSVTLVAAGEPLFSCQLGQAAGYYTLRLKEQMSSNTSKSKGKRP